MSGWRAWGLVGLIVLAPACKGLTYACIEDGECGAEGRCEAEGWCSFPDERCESGRRYAEFSGGGLGRACVDVSPGSTSGRSTTTDASTTDVSTSTESGASSGEPIIETGSTSTGSTTLVDPTTSSGTASSSGSSGENPCVGWVDEFDDGVIGPEWTVYGDVVPGGHVMEEADGVLRWMFAEGLVQQRGVYRVLSDTIEGVRVQTEGLSEIAEAQTVLLIRDPSTPPDLFLVWGNGSVDFRIGSTSVATAEEQGWVDVHFEGDRVLVSQSSDGFDFELLADVEVPTDPGGLELFLYGQTWTEAPVPAAAAFERIQLCEP